MDDVHINPLKHGLAKRMADWPYSTFHRLVAQDVYPQDWADRDEDGVGYLIDSCGAIPFGYCALRATPDSRLNATFYPYVYMATTVVLC